MTTTTPAPAGAVSIAHAASSLDVAESVIRQAVHAGEIPAARIGNRIRIAKADLAAWFALRMLVEHEPKVNH